jgi:hypothetical protein
MRHLSSLKLARAVPDSDNDPSVFIVYRIFGCSLSKDVNLKDLPHPAMQRFAVINPQRVDDEVFEILEAARDIGALAPVKLMDVGVKSLYLLLDTKVDSTIVTAIESLWMAVMGVNSHHNITVHFACESEVFSGRSDYPYWCGAKEILETEELGLTRDVLPAIAAPTPENDRSEGLRLRTGHEAYLVYSTMRMSDIQSRPGCRDKNKKKPNPMSLTRKELERYWALINERMLSEFTRTRTFESWQSKKRAIGEYELETSKPKKKRHAKENPQGTTFSEEEVAVARVKHDLRNAKLLR